MTAAADAATVTDQLLIVTTEESSLYSALFYLFNKFTVAQLHKMTHRVPYNCKILRHNTALTDNLRHTQAVSSAERVHCLALLDH